jgi:hypothetical protein
MNSKSEYEKDWGVPQFAPPHEKQISPGQNAAFGDENVNTFLGQMPKDIPGLRIGTPENKKVIDDMISAAPVGNAMNIVSSAAPKAIQSIMTNPRKLIDMVQKGHDLLHNESSGIYNLVKEKAKNMKINVGHDILDEAHEITNSKSLERVIDNAKGGNYDSLHSLQSELGKLASKGLSSDLPSEMLKGRDYLYIRKKINDAIRNHFINSGENDLAHLLDKGSSKFAEKMQTYFEHPAIGKIVHPELRHIPRDIYGVFSEESKPMSDVINKHPGMKEIMDLLASKKNILKNIRNVGIGVPVTGGSLYGLKAGYDMFNKLMGGK